MSKVLIIGSGAREHSIALKFAESSKVTKIFVSPGNAGINAAFQGVILNTNVEIITYVKQEQIDLVFVGPEKPLAEGIVDELIAAGIVCFGPTRRASKIEASKAFAKKFMTRYDIPTANYHVFDTNTLQDAIDFGNTVKRPIVIKASGLANGKGVIIPEPNEDLSEII